MITMIKQSVSRSPLLYLHKYNREGLWRLETGQVHSPYHFWQDGGGDDRNIRSREALQASVDYIHNNPVRKGLVPYPEDRIRSSTREWARVEQGPISIDRDSFPFTEDTSKQSLKVPPGRGTVTVRCLRTDYSSFSAICLMASWVSANRASISIMCACCSRWRATPARMAYAMVQNRAR